MKNKWYLDNYYNKGKRFASKSLSFYYIKFEFLKQPEVRILSMRPSRL